MNEELKDINQKNTIDPKSMPESDFVSQVIGSLSHELRTPLAIISSNVQVLRDFGRTKGDDLARNSILLCEEAVGSMERFIDDIHFLNLSNKNVITHNPQMIDLSRYFNHFLENYSISNYYKKRLKLNVNLSNVNMNIDTGLLDRSLYSFIDNALKFSSDVVTLNVNSTDKELFVCVGDSGFGIPSDDVGSIFNPFFRCNNAKMISGCGLGLPIAKRAVDVMGGHVEVISEVQKGTMVKLKIPNYGG